MNKETTMESPDYTNLLDYINWSGIVNDYALTSGDLSLEQEMELEKLLKQYIEQNKWWKQKLKHSLPPF